MVHEVARALGSECALLEGHVLLGLRVERRILDEAVDEDLGSGLGLGLGLGSGLGLGFSMRQLTKT
jgi:hypothetical protein